MDFVLVDDSVISAYTQRVARIVDGVEKLQDRMNAILENVLGEDYTMDNSPVVNEPTAFVKPAEPVEYDEPLSDNIFYEDDIGYGDDMNFVDDVYDDLDAEVNVGSQFNEMDQTTASAAIDMSLDEHLYDDSFGMDDDLDIDLDAMLDGISFDVDDLEL